MTRALSSLRKAAILLRSLDKASADQLMRQLLPACADAVTAELAHLEAVDADEQRQVVEELRQLWNDRRENTRSAIAPQRSGNTPRDRGTRVDAGPAGSAAQAHSEQPPFAAERASSEQDARGTPELRRASNTAPFRFLKHVPLHALCGAIRQEQPRVIAYVLSHLSAGRAAKVLENLPAPLQHEVVRFLSAPHTVQDGLSGPIEARLRGRIEAEAAVGQRQADGVTKAAQLLNRTKRATAGRILAGLEREDPELAARLHRQRWSIDDLTHLDDALLGVTVSHMEPADLALALKGASAQFCDRCFRLLPKRMARHVKGHLKSLGPVRLSDIETAQAYLMTLVAEASSFSGNLLGADC